MTTASLTASDPARAAPARSAAVRLWLAVVAALIVVMILVGGATRLTGSGLSITEWKPVTGALLPMGEDAWAAEFEKYRATPQYALANKGMNPAEFRTIYLWEWSHRALGRLIGFAYLVPLVVFVWRGTVRGRLMWTLIAIGALGGLQGAVGWIMVASGLKPGMVAVAPVKLMLHLVVACAILAALVAVIVGLRGRAPSPQWGERARLRHTAAALVALVFVQIALGALVAGLDAGLVYNTWPTMDGMLVPGADVLLPRAPWWANFFETTATVQFDHRLGAYLLFAVAAAHALDARRRAAGRAARRAATLALLVTAQAAVGIVTLVLKVPLWAGLLHQGLAVAVLMLAAAHWRLLAATADGRQGAAA